MRQYSVSQKGWGILKSKKKRYLILWLLLLLLMIFYEKSETGMEGAKVVRNEPGGGAKQEELEASVEGEKYTVSLEVEERKYTQKEAKEKIQEAKKEIDATFPGKNKSLDHITGAVIMEESYQDGAVDAQWDMGEQDVVGPNGQIEKPDISKEGELVVASVILSCAEEEEIYRFSFMVFPSKLGVGEKLAESFHKTEEIHREDKEVALPKEIAGKEVMWNAKPTHLVLKFLIFSVIIAILLKARNLEEIQNQKKEREHELQLYYPQLVTTLSLLTGAGMTVSRAWERMVTQYRSKKGGRKNVAMEEMCNTLNEIRDGVGEVKAYENFGRRCGLRQYKKLSSLITQNLRKGSLELAALLNKEAEQSMAYRRNLAKKLGEEASTKMLAPMILMLAIVLAIVIVPAWLTL